MNVTRVLLTHTYHYYDGRKNWGLFSLQIHYHHNLDVNTTVYMFRREGKSKSLLYYPFIILFFAFAQRNDSYDHYVPLYFDPRSTNLWYWSDDCFQRYAVYIQRGPLTAKGIISVFEIRNYLIISPYVNKTSLQKSINIMAFIFIGIENIFRNTQKCFQTIIYLIF